MADAGSKLNRRACRLGRARARAGRDRSRAGRHAQEQGGERGGAGRDPEQDRRTPRGSGRARAGAGRGPDARPARRPTDVEQLQAEAAAVEPRLTAMKARARPGRPRAGRTPAGDRRQLRQGRARPSRRWRRSASSSRSEPCRRGRALAALALLLMAPSPAAAAPLEVVEVAPDVFVHAGRQEDFTPVNLGGIANLGFVIGERSVAVIDTGGSRRRGAGAAGGDPGPHRPADQPRRSTRTSIPTTCWATSRSRATGAAVVGPRQAGRAPGRGRPLLPGQPAPPDRPRLRRHRAGAADAVRGRRPSPSIWAAGRSSCAPGPPPTPTPT